MHGIHSHNFRDVIADMLMTEDDVTHAHMILIATVDDIITTLKQVNVVLV